MGHRFCSRTSVETAWGMYVFSMNSRSKSLTRASDGRKSTVRLDNWCRSLSLRSSSGVACCTVGPTLTQTRPRYRKGAPVDG